MKIEVEVDDEIAMLLSRLVERTTRFDKRSTLTVPGLARMLLEDAALAIHRPGSWEGSKVADLLRSQGYDIS